MDCANHHCLLVVSGLYKPLLFVGGEWIISTIIGCWWLVLYIKRHCLLVVSVLYQPSLFVGS
jgi:hypothetical protein